MVEATPAWPRTTDDRVRVLIPVLPTTRREFGGTDSATLVFRIYQRRDRTPKEITRTLRITNERDAEVLGTTETISSAAFAPGSPVEQRLTLPLAEKDGVTLRGLPAAACGRRIGPEKIHNHKQHSISGCLWLWIFSGPRRAKRAGRPSVFFVCPRVPPCLRAVLVP